MNATFFDGLDKFYHHAKFMEDRTTRAGCRCVNVVFVFWSCSKSGALCAEHCAFEGCIARTSIELLFIGQFQ